MLVEVGATILPYMPPYIWSCSVRPAPAMTGVVSAGARGPTVKQVHAVKVEHMLAARVR